MAGTNDGLLVMVPVPTPGRPRVCANTPRITMRFLISLPSQNRGFAVPEVGRVAHPDGASVFEAEHSRSSVVFTRQEWPQSNRQKPRPTAGGGEGSSSRGYDLHVSLAFSKQVISST